MPEAEGRAGLLEGAELWPVRPSTSVHSPGPQTSRARRTGVVLGSMCTAFSSMCTALDHRPAGRDVQEWCWVPCAQHSIPCAQPWTTDQQGAARRNRARIGAGLEHSSTFLRHACTGAILVTPERLTTQTRTHAHPHPHRSPHREVPPPASSTRPHSQGRTHPHLSLHCAACLTTRKPNIRRC